MANINETSRQVSLISQLWDMSGPCEGDLYYGLYDMDNIPTLVMDIKTAITLVRKGNIIRVKEYWMLVN